MQTKIADGFQYNTGPGPFDFITSAFDGAFFWFVLMTLWPNGLKPDSEAENP